MVFHANTCGSYKHRIHFTFLQFDQFRVIASYLLSNMKFSETIGLLCGVVKEKAKPISPLGHLSNTQKHEFTLIPALRCFIGHLMTCHYRTVPFLRCFHLRNSKFPGDYDDPAILAAETVFSVSEVEALHELFKKLSNALIEDGLIHKEEFQLALFQNSKKQSLFADRVFTLFDLKQNGVIDFGEFVRSLSVFHPKTPLSEKINFSFRIYDLRQTGFIEREEVQEMLVALLSEAEIELSEDAISTILDKTFREADTNKDGRIDVEEWRSFVLKYPSLMKIMTLPYLKDVTTSYPSFIFNSKVKDIEKHQCKRNRRHVSDIED